MVRVSSSIDISTSLRSSPGISALTSIALPVSEISILGTIFACAPAGPIPCAKSLNRRSISRCRPNNPKPGGLKAVPFSRDGTSDLNLMGSSFYLGLGDAGRRPGDALGFFALDPGANGTLQYHLAAVGFDGDPVGVHLGAALERFLDLAFQVRGLHLRLDCDDVGYPLHALHLSHGGVG